MATSNTSILASYNFILRCGNAHEPKTFVRSVLENINIICKFDQGMAFYYDGNGKIINQDLINVDRKWLSAYYDYYSKMDNTSIGLASAKNLLHENERPSNIIHHVWKKKASNEFVRDYISEKGLVSSLSFTLHDLEGSPKVCITLDKMGKSRDFSENEIRLVELVYPLLNNTYKNFFYEKPQKKKAEDIDWDNMDLTKRETEVTGLLCQGVSPANISRTLYITPATTYKHIAHIYAKMNVSSRQELLVKLLAY